MRAIQKQLIQIEIAWDKRILPGIRTRECEKVFNDVREALRLVEKNRQRLAVFLGRARSAREGHLRFPAENGHGRAKFVRSIRHEAALTLKRLIEPVEKKVKGLREMAKLVLVVLYRKPF